MKKIAFGFMFLVVLVLAACGPTEEQDNLVNYINDDMKPLGPLEGEAVKDYEGVTGDNYTDDETLYNTLDKDVIPKYAKLIKKLEAVNVSDKEIKRIHKNYVDAANAQYSAFEMTKEAFEKQDENLITEANKKLTEGRKGMNKYKNEIKALADERDVKLETE